MNRWTLVLFLLCVLPLSALRAPQHTLDQLDPKEPAGYFEVGEWLAATAAGDRDRAVAWGVLAMGIGLADRAGEDELAASLCIALADSETDAQQSSLLWDLALLKDPSRLEAWSRHRDAGAVEAMRLRQQAAQCLYFARNWDHNEASSRYAQRGIKQLILTTAADLGIDAPWVDQVIAELITGSDADPCRGRVFIRKAEDGEALRLVCPGHPRPIGVGADDEGLGKLLRIEMALLGASSHAGLEDWSTAAYLGRTRPARDPSIVGVLDHYRVDLSRPFWRGGGWVSIR